MKISPFQKSSTQVTSNKLEAKSKDNFVLAKAKFAGRTVKSLGQDGKAVF